MRKVTPSVVVIDVNRGEVGRDNSFRWGFPVPYRRVDA